MSYICKYRGDKHVRVTGTLKSFGKKRYINATHIRNVKDSHEVYFHILEAIAVNLTMERGPVSLPLPELFLPYFHPSQAFQPQFCTPNQICI